MRVIELTQGMATILDDEDYDKFAQYRWCFSKVKGGGYAVRGGRKSEGRSKLVLLHREIMNAPEGMVVDHKNGDTLDNRKCNLRICTETQNHQNAKKASHNTTGFKGVSFSKKRQRFFAQIVSHGKHHWLGQFVTAVEAHAAYCEAASRLHGDFARHN